MSTTNTTTQPSPAHELTIVSIPANHPAEQSRHSGPPIAQDETLRAEDTSIRPGRRVFDVAPANILSRRRRIAVTVLIVLANLMQMISNCVGVVGGLKISQIWGVTGVHATWVAASYPLTQGTFVLISGRLGAVYGHKNMLILGGAWFILFTFINGFIPNYIAFNLVRALSGIGGALILPNAAAMIGITNPPGRARNLSMGLLGASAPIGGYIGGVIVGLFIEYSRAEWCFMFIALTSICVFLPLWILIPKERPVDRHGRIDYIGAILGTSALIIFSFVWNEAPAVGWSTPLTLTPLALSLGLFATFLLWEFKVSHPIMPLTIFRAPSLLQLLAVVLLNFMTMGTALWYMLLWQQNLRHWTVLQIAIGWTPFLIVATLGSGLAAWLIPRMAPQWIVAIGTVTGGLSSLLLATMPTRQSYWAQLFPATICMALCPDLIYTAAQIIASNTVRRDQQGTAGSLIGTLNLYGVSLGLGFASTVENQVVRKHASTVLGYRSALFFGVGVAALAFLIDVFFVRLRKDEREGWLHEDDLDLGESDRA